MIADRQSNGKLSGNLIGVEVDMTVDATAMAHVMQMFTDLYSDPILAVIREYSTNALDAQLEAGFPGPIEVTLPGPLAPFLTVRDFGVGLDEAGIKRYYAQYGASTKRESDLFNGMLGIGCKSALTYTNQFTVSSVKDGVRTVVAITRKDDGTGGMTVLPASQTDDANGTEVKIPCKSGDADAFQRTASTFYSFWKPGQVLLNGEEPQRHGGLRLTDDLFLTHDGVSKVVIGNVAYPLELQRISGLGSLQHSGLGIVAYLDMDKFTVRPFTPSRESLDYRAETVKVLDTIVPTFTTAIKGAIQREVDLAASPQAAIQLVADWSRRMPGNLNNPSAYTYKGRDVPVAFRHTTKVQDRWGGMEIRPVQVTPNTDYHGSLSRVDNRPSVAATEWGTAIWVTGWNLAKLTPQHKRKLRQAVQNAKIDAQSVQRFYLIPPGESIPDFWIDPARVFKWDDVNAIKMPRVVGTGVGGSTRPTGSYDCYVFDGSSAPFSHVQAADIKTTKPILYVRGNRYQGRTYTDVLTAIHKGGFTLACLPANRVEKFKRTFPKAEQCRDAVLAARDAWWKSVPADTKTALAMSDERGLDTLRKLDPARVDDPDLQKAIMLASKRLHTVEETRTMFGRIVGRPANVTWTDPLDKYPLYHSSRYGVDMEHVYIYINAVYAAQQTKGV